MPSVYDIVTTKFVDQLKAGVVPWRKPWSCGSLPQNLISKKAYSGVNVYLLLMSGYSSPYWLTYNQATQKGGSVRKGEKSTLITFFKSMKSKKDPNKSIPMFRYYKVFNIEQCDGIEVPQSSELDFVEDRNAEKVMALYADCPPIAHGGDSARYSPLADAITMPTKGQFDSVNSYYLTLFHESIHSTGHKSRLDRLKIGCFERTQATYAFEELVAELGANFLAHEAGIDPSGLFDNSAAYIAGWLKALQNDTKLIVSAASHAQKAVEYMQGVTAKAVA